jgi:hypothetical protein
MNVSLFFRRACCLANANRLLFATLNADGKLGSCNASNAALSILALSLARAVAASILVTPVVLVLLIGLCADAADELPCE